MSLPLILKLFYSAMTIIVVSLMGFYVRGLASGHRIGLRAETLFKGWIGLLVVVAISFHLLTAWRVPWVHWEVNRHRIKADREIAVDIAGHRFRLPEGGISIRQGETVRFALTSRDLTYGFGVFRKNGTMEFQMQVLPGHSNEIVWMFREPGRYSIRSTEYAGVDTGRMYVKNAIEVLPVPATHAQRPGSRRIKHDHYESGLVSCPDGEDGLRSMAAPLSPLAAWPFAVPGKED